jgi:hypothetical protein
MPEQTEEELSALRDNIEKKGKNSYYYAHGPKIDGPKWDGKEEPRLLSKGDHADNVDAIAANTFVPYTIFSEYAWGDGNKLVTIYIDFENAMDVPSDIINIDNTVDSVTFTINNYNNKNYKLYIDNLSSEISTCKYKVKDGQFKILLTKLDESPWFKLKK